jgi:TolB-like protein
MVKKMILTLALVATSFPCWAAVNLEDLAKNAVSSMVNTVKDPDLKHLGILSIQDETGEIDTEEMSEVLTYELVNDGRFQVVERGLLNELIKEIEYEKNSGYFNQQKANQYGGIKGIDGLLVGKVYKSEIEGEERPILILKLLDLEHQSLVWATEINLSEEESPFEIPANAISSSIKEAENRLKERGIKRIAIWNISNNTELKLNKPFLMDKLTANLVAKTDIAVIDRGNIKELYKEKELTEKYDLWVDQETFAGLGKGYGINAVIYGAIYENPILHKKNSSLILKMVDIERGILVWAKEVPLSEDYIETGVDLAVLDMVNNLKKTESNLEIKRISLLQFVDETTEKKIDDQTVVDKIIAQMVGNLSLEVVDRESLEAFKEEIKKAKEGVLDKKIMAKKGNSRGIDAFIYGKLTQASEELEKNQVIYKAKLLVNLIAVESMITVAVEKGAGEKVITSKEKVESFKKEVEGFKKIEKKKKELLRLISERDVHLTKLKNKYNPEWRENLTSPGIFWLGVILYGVGLIPCLGNDEGKEPTEDAKEAGEQIRMIGSIVISLGGIGYIAEHIIWSSIEEGIKEDEQEIKRLNEELNKISFNYNLKNNQMAFNYHFRF